MKITSVFLSADGESVALELDGGDGGIIVYRPETGDFRDVESLGDEWQRMHT